MSKEKVKKKRKSGEADDINKQTIYIVPKSKIEPRAHYAPEPKWGCHCPSNSCKTLVIFYSSAKK